MQSAGSRSEADLSRMGPTLVIASSLILAIRTAKWRRAELDAKAQLEWEQEVEQSVKMAHRIFAHLLSKSPFLFPQKEVSCYRLEEEE